jgi:hypothetical protein
MRRPWHAGAAPLAEVERLANLISDRISPRLVAELETLPWWCTPARAAPITWFSRVLPQALMCGWAPPIAASMTSRW